MTGFKLCRCWMQFFHERFPLHFSIPVIVLFVLGNEAVAVRSMDSYFHPWKTLVALLMCVSFFYRLVIFNDMRDGLSPLVTYRQAVIAVFSLIGFEMLLTLIVGIDSFIAHLFPISWSLLIWREFFCRDWLHRHPIFYTMIRAPVLALVGYSVGVTSLEVSLLDFDWNFYSFGIANWALFNVFFFSEMGLVLAMGLIACFVGMESLLFLGLIPVAASGYVGRYFDQVKYLYLGYYYLILIL